jgi:prohibitin 1
MRKTWFLLPVLLLMTGCSIIRPGEVGVRSSFGQLGDGARPSGLIVHSPVGVRYIRVPVRTVNLEVKLDIPSKEGLNVKSEVSILYRVEAEKARAVVEQVGEEYEQDLVLPVFRSAVADVSSRFYAKDMHSGERSRIENEIRARMSEILGPRGFVTESVLMKSIQLPPGLYAAVEAKLASEQAAQQMEFELQREKLEAQRAVILAEGKANAARIAAQGQRDAAVLAAEGDRDAEKLRADGVAEANRLAGQTLTPVILKWRAVEAFERLSTSPNSKVIVNPGNAQILVD